MKILKKNETLKKMEISQKWKYESYYMTKMKILTKKNKNWKKILIKGMIYVKKKEIFFQKKK